MSAPQQHPFRAVKLTRFVLEEQDEPYRVWATVKATGERREAIFPNKRLAIKERDRVYANELLTAQGMGRV